MFLSLMKEKDARNIKIKKENFIPWNNYLLCLQQEEMIYNSYNNSKEEYQKN